MTASHPPFHSPQVTIEKPLSRKEDGSCDWKKKIPAKTVTIFAVNPSEAVMIPCQRFGDSHFLKIMLLRFPASLSYFKLSARFFTRAFDNLKLVQYVEQFHSSPGYKCLKMIVFTFLGNLIKEAEFLCVLKCKHLMETLSNLIGFRHLMLGNVSVFCEQLYLRLAMHLR